MLLYNIIIKIEEEEKKKITWFDVFYAFHSSEDNSILFLTKQASQNLQKKNKNKYTYLTYVQ